MYFRQVVLIAALACSCTQHYEEKVFDFPLSSKNLPDSVGFLVPTLASEIKFPYSTCHITDSVLVFYDNSKTHCLTALSLNTGDTLARLIRKGRGPDEALLISPFYEIVDGIASTVDCMNSRYIEIDIQKSIRSGSAVVLKSVPLGDSGLSTFRSTKLIGRDTLICYDENADVYSNTLKGPPIFSLFDLKSGHCFANYQVVSDASMKLVKKSPVEERSLFRFHDCLIPQNHTVCLAFIHFPVIAFFNYEEGTFCGYKIDGISSYSHRKATYCFNGILCDGENIYLLFLGKSRPELTDNEQGENLRTKILKMDLNGDILSCYELNGFYASIMNKEESLLLRNMDDGFFYQIKKDIL